LIGDDDLIRPAAKLPPSETLTDPRPAAGLSPSGAM
jgi:hypothetical protein